MKAPSITSLIRLLVGSTFLMAITAPSQGFGKPKTVSARLSKSSQHVSTTIPTQQRILPRKLPSQVALKNMPDLSSIQRNSPVRSNRSAELSTTRRLPALSQTRARIQKQTSILSRERLSDRNPVTDIKLPELSHRKIRDLDERLRDIENANRHRHDELGQALGLPEGVDPGKVPGHGCDPRKEPNLAHSDESYNRRNGASDVSNEWWNWDNATLGKALNWGSDSGPFDREGGTTHAWGSGDSDLDWDDADEDTGETGDADSDGDGGEAAGTGASAGGSAGDAAPDYDFTEGMENQVDMDFSNDPEPEGGDPDELRGLARERALAEGGLSARSAGTGTYNPGGKTRSRPGQWLPGESAREHWQRVTQGNPDPEGGGPAELTGLDQSRISRAATHQPTPGGEDPDDPRAGDGQNAGRALSTTGVNLPQLSHFLQPTPDDEQGSGGPIDPRAGR